MTIVHPRAGLRRVRAVRSWIAEMVMIVFLLGFLATYAYFIFVMLLLLHRAAQK